MKSKLVSLFVVLTWAVISVTPVVADEPGGEPDVTPDTDPWDPGGLAQPTDGQQVLGDSSELLLRVAPYLWSLSWVAR